MVRSEENMKKLIAMLALTGPALGGDILVDELDINKDGELDQIYYNAVGNRVEFKVVVNGTTYRRGIRINSSVSDVKVTGVTPTLSDGSATHVFQVEVEGTDGSTSIYPVPLDSIESDFEWSMLEWTRANARNFAGKTDRWLETHCLNVGGSEVEWKILVGTYRDTQTAVVWYAPGFDSTTSMDIEPTITNWEDDGPCDNVPGLGGTYRCTFHLPQNNNTIGFNFASFQYSGGTVTTKCWRRRFETDF